MPVTQLKRRHTLEDKNLLPLLKTLRDFRGEPVKEMAKFGVTPTEDLSIEQLAKQFSELAGGETILTDFVEMSGREMNIGNARLALHLPILHANEFGQPGQEFRQPAAHTGKTPMTIPKRPRTEEALERRIQQLDEQSRDESVQTSKDKVRAFALQSHPSEPMILMLLDELVRTARRQGHHEADVFEELTRQASKHQGKLSIPSLCLSVIGGRASDAISKALAKCLKEKQFETTLEAASESKPAEAQKSQSPLANLYPPAPMFCPMQASATPVQTPYSGYQGYFPSNYSGGQMQRYPRSQMRPPRPRGVCMFCESPDHYIKDCDKMKEANKK